MIGKVEHCIHYIKRIKRNKQEPTMNRQNKKLHRYIILIISQKMRLNFATKTTNINHQQITHPKLQQKTRHCKSETWLKYPPTQGSPPVTEYTKATYLPGLGKLDSAIVNQLNAIAPRIEKVLKWAR